MICLPHSLRYAPLLLGLLWSNGTLAAEPAANLLAGQQLWSQPGITKNQLQRRCATCHGTNLTQPGQHILTGKPLAPMAASVSPDRYQDMEKVTLWLNRNCQWTFGQLCTPQQQAQLLAYLKSL
ncbi:hypothetical protein Mmc1_0315 [Magnetococcus marinus MC-1]|uniref:Cytochrome c domain-containing protein n=1 Tax=Magnetococcus marinus (strain ATCC BAA-1437 / JCM 17883 / MC-1) TaxID=156889 RepID=A0L4E9_MAGMM|nr:DUF1924 domain-containing protein [Magnetococcus marinus]ABK42842.1 hypothetical protein Mmc1_0315 [Magnetococcus marinus MC-1]